MPDVERLKIQVLGPRNFPAAACTIPTELLYDYEALLAEARKRHPQFSHEALIRYIWVRGLDSLRMAVYGRFGPPNPNEMPRPQRGKGLI